MRRPDVPTAIAAAAVVAALSATPAVAAEAPRALTAEAYPGNVLQVGLDDPPSPARSPA